ncbi:9436_t:CDS:2, partial [Racocetra fulgida]
DDILVLHPSMKTTVLSEFRMTVHEVKETLDATVTENKEGERCLNNYVLKEVIGQGAYGTVNLAVDKLTGNKYAIKEFSKTRLRKKTNYFRRPRGRFGKVMENYDPSSSDPLYLIRGEVAVLKKLNHPNVIKLFEVLDDEQDSLYMDIKPDNLLLSAEGVLKIVDFGVSEMFTEGNDKMKKSAGSPAFMAPEHPWVNNHGKDPLISTEENCSELVTEITVDDLNSAIKLLSFRSIVVVHRAVQQFKRLSKSHHYSAEEMDKLKKDVQDAEEKKEMEVTEHIAIITE